MISKRVSLPFQYVGILGTICMMMLSVVVSCMKDEDYSTSPDDGFVFSQDTIAFNTVISGQPTNTYTFQVYNPSARAIRITQVFLEGGASSPYRVNVDGTFLEGGQASDFEIRSQDSIRVFLYLNANDADMDLPIPVNDRLHFRSEGGALGTVVLEAAAQSVVPLNGWVCQSDTILDAKRPYQIMDSLVVAEGATLRLAPGTRLYFHADAGLRIDGTLIAQGTLQCPIVMKGDRLGNMFSDQPYDRIPSQWQGIVITDKSKGNVFNYCDIHSSVWGIKVDSTDISHQSLLMENTILHNVARHALEVRHAQVFLGNSQITNAGGNCVHLRGGDATFVHCTIANFYPFAGGRGVALDFANYDGEIRLPLQRAHFFNCLITGYGEDEIMGSASERYTDDAFNYGFHYCMLNTPQVEDENAFINCVWETKEDSTAREKNFTPEFDLDKLLFHFTLNPNSRAVDAADADISREWYPIDLAGRPRRSSDNTGDLPDMGCYDGSRVKGQELRVFFR